MYFSQLNFLLNIYEKQRQHFLQLLVVLLSETRRSDFGSARAQVKELPFFSISPPTATVTAAIQIFARLLLFSALPHANEVIISF